MSASKRKGTRWESALVAWMREHGHPRAERRALAGRLDVGDVCNALDGDLVIEAKDAATLRLYDWCDEAERERVAAGARYAFVAVKRYGTSDVGRGYAVWTIEKANELLLELADLRQFRQMIEDEDALRTGAQ